jgi:mono/diheme cytochrome c family protein
MAAMLAACVFAAHAESDREYCERQQGPAKVVCLRDLGKTEAKTSAAAPAAETDRAYCERQQGPAKIVCLRDLGKTEAKISAAAPAAETDRAYCERQQGPAKIVCLRDLGKAEAKPVVAPAPAAVAAVSTAKGPSGPAPYKVVDGYHVDAKTLKGFQTWRAAACDRCHGANQQGLVGPSLVNSLKVLTKEQFVQTVTNGRLEKGMPSFATNTTVVANIDSLYAYLKGRSDGAITKAHVEPIK